MTQDTLRVSTARISLLKVGANGPATGRKWREFLKLEAAAAVDVGGGLAVQVVQPMTEGWNMAMKNDVAKAVKEAAAKGWRAQLRVILDHFGWQKVNPKRGKVVSNRTQEVREKGLFRMFEELRGLKGGNSAPLKCEPQNIGRKHVDFLIEKWISEGNKPATLQGKVSLLRTFADWIGKPGLVPPNEILFAGREHLVVRSYTRTEDPSPEFHGIAREELLEKATKADVRFGLMQRFNILFGTRKREVLCIRPWEADLGDVFSFYPGEAGGYTGTKNGRPRGVPIDTPEKRAVVDAIKAVVKPGMALGWFDGKKDGLKKSENRYEYLCTKIGLTKDDLGFTGHALRATALVESAERKGINPPVKGLVRDADGNVVQTLTSEQLDVARRQLAQESGHSRTNITNAYIGSFRGNKPGAGAGAAPAASGGKAGSPNAAAREKGDGEDDDGEAVPA
jgi:integrase